KVIEPIWHEKTETANRERGRIEHVLDWATVRGYRSGDNPARWRGHLQSMLPSRAKLAPVKHHPALHYSKLPAFMTRLRARSATAARALEFTILTAARTEEVIGACQREVDFDNKVWTVPAKRMKRPREHKVPLSARALEILAELPQAESDGHLFSGPDQIE